MSTFSKDLAQAMKAASVDEQEIAELVDVPIPTVKRWLAGKTWPHPAIAEGILEMIAEGYMQEDDQ